MKTLLNTLVYTNILLGISIIFLLMLFASPEIATLFNGMLITYFGSSLIIYITFFKSIIGWQKKVHSNITYYSISLYFIMAHFRNSYDTLVKKENSTTLIGRPQLKIDFYRK